MDAKAVCDAPSPRPSPARGEGGREGEADIPPFEILAADPEIAALLDFEPVVRKRRVAGGWTAELQRKFVANVAAVGSRTRAAEALGHEVAGASKLCRAVGGESFSAACDAALELYERREEAKAAENPGRAWAPPLRSRRRAPTDDQWDDAEAAREAADGIAGKLLRIRRLFLAEIGPSPAKRAAFEILSNFPVDWDKAARLEPQADEPYRTSSQRQPDMILMADSGWSFGEWGYGPDRKAEQRRAIDEWRAEQGLEPVDWDGEEDK